MTVLSIWWSCIWLLWSSLCQFRQWMMDNGIFCILHFFFFAYIPVLCFFDLNLFEHHCCCLIFPHNAWSDLSSTLDTSHPWWSGDEFFANCRNIYSAQTLFFGYFDTLYTVYPLRALQKCNSTKVISVAYCASTYINSC